MCLMLISAEENRCTIHCTLKFYIIFTVHLFWNCLLFCLTFASINWISSPAWKNPHTNLLLIAWFLLSISKIENLCKMFYFIFCSGREIWVCDFSFSMPYFWQKRIHKQHIPKSFGFSITHEISLLHSTWTTFCFFLCGWIQQQIGSSIFIFSVC